MELSHKASCLFDKLKETINLAVRQGYGSLDSIARIDSDDLEGLRSVNELIEESQEYFVREAGTLDEMSDKLYHLQRQMDIMNNKLNILLEKVGEREKED